jgi:hypothetical protein
LDNFIPKELRVDKIATDIGKDPGSLFKNMLAQNDKKKKERAAKRAAQIRKIKRARLAAKKKKALAAKAKAAKEKDALAKS